MQRMTRMTRSVWVTMLVALGCGAEDGEQGTPAAFTSLVQTCGPADGPAVSLFLAEHPLGIGYPEPPYSEISVYRGVDQVEGRQFEVNSSTQTAAAQVCSSSRECHPAGPGTIRFGSMARDSTIEVSYRLEGTGTGKLIGGRARIRLQPRAGFCG